MDIEEVRRIASNAMDAGNKFQSSELEIYINESNATNINIQNGRLSSTESNSDFGLGCRIAFGNQVAIGFTNLVSEKAIQKMIEDTAKTAKKVPSDPDWQGFPKKSGALSNEKFYYPQLADTSIEDLAEITQDLLSNCKVEGYQEPVIPIIGSTVLVDGSSLLLNSHGIEAFNQVSLFYSYIGALALNGGKPGPMHLDLYLSREKLIPDASTFASKIASEAVNLVSAKKAKLSEELLPVVFHPWALRSIAEFIFFPSLKADNKQIGNSFLADRLGEELVPPAFQMYDDGTIRDCTGSDLYDQEGIARKKTSIFEDGVFKNF
ncbi:MAG: metallopeptidase TldD-related protein, partial [Candidatus Hodarchaeales archaeon]